jgi:hypothetical protein
MQEITAMQSINVVVLKIEIGLVISLLVIESVEIVVLMFDLQLLPRIAWPRGETGGPLRPCWTSSIQAQ